MKPLVWLGATSSGGLALPDASPTPCSFYAPRGVFLNDDLLIVVDTGNHRALIWHGHPTETGAPADVVLGQRNFYSEGPKSAGSSIASGLFLPTASGVWEGRLFVADAWHHRILVWNHVPTASGTPPDYAIGQSDLESVEANRGGSTSRNSLWCPYGIAFVGGRFHVTDTSNRRVLGWQGLPERNQLPDSLLGQSDWNHGEESRGEGVGARSFRWPHAVADVGDYVYLADAGNHRVLGWRGGLRLDRDADVMIGQKNFQLSEEFAYRPQGAARLRFPYAIASNGSRLAVGDTANNRVLLWETLPSGEIASTEASAVIGQPNFDANGENHWIAITSVTPCWPYGICWHGDKLAIADSGNNRVMLWSTVDIAPEQAISELELTGALPCV